MKKIVIILGLILMSTLIIACSNDDGVPGDNNTKGCTKEYAPVCATADIRCIKAPCPQEMTYGNACMAENAGETVLYEGECTVQNKEPKMCTKEYNPQCGVDGKTYSNPCMAGDVEIAYPGPCNAEIKAGCQDYNGSWLSNSTECVGISESACNELGGEFNECASACRNNPEAQMCTMQCVVVCQFE